MKKLLLVLFLVLTGCSQADVQPEPVEDKGKNVLVLYYDYSENMGDTSSMDEDAITSASLHGDNNGVEKNNILVIADEIAKKTDAKTFSVRVNEPYDPDYDTMVNIAREDIDNDKDFTFKEDIDIKDYDTIYVGMPVWWSSLPQPMKVFLRNHDFSNKTIIPFGIHRGSRFGNMIEELKDVTDANVIEDGYTINATTDNDEVRQGVDEWLGE